MSTIVLASSNRGKVAELQNLLGELSYDIVPQGQYQVPDADETGLSFVENAILKARNACQFTGLPAIADDSGIEVDALDGQPGIYSARYSGEHGDDTANNEKLIAALQNIELGQRTARYQCVLVYLRHAQDPTPLICQAAWEGIILQAPQGEGGFGYDPLFWLEELQCSAAELAPDHKNRISHRGRALQLLHRQLQLLRNRTP